MARTFAAIRAEDLIYSGAVRRYYLGEADLPTDIGVRNADSTRMPARTLSEYLRGLFVENRLTAGRFAVEGRVIALKDIDAPMFVVATENDHIAPWKSVCKVQLFADNDLTFALVKGGHNGGIVSEPGHAGRHYRLSHRAAGGHQFRPAPELISDLAQLMYEGALPVIPMYVDSPVATKATDVFAQHASELENGATLMHGLRSRQLHFTETREQSMALDQVQGFHIVIAASGMCDAGRIRHRLKNRIWMDQATVLFTGFQAEGTLGRSLQNGVRTIRIQGEEFQVRARIRSLDLYSGHADATELVQWIKDRLPLIHDLFLVHGEAAAIDALAARLAGIVDPSHVQRPVLDESFALTAQGLRRLSIPHRPGWHRKRSRGWIGTTTCRTCSSASTSPWVPRRTNGPATFCSAACAWRWPGKMKSHGVVRIACAIAANACPRAAAESRPHLGGSSTPEARAGDCAGGLVRKNHAFASSVAAM